MEARASGRCLPIFFARRATAGIRFTTDSRTDLAAVRERVLGTTCGSIVCCRFVPREIQRMRNTCIRYCFDVIDRCLVLWSNPGENVLTPFMGVGSEVYSAVRNGRRGVGWNSPSYYRQAMKNVAEALKAPLDEQAGLFDEEATADSNEEEAS